MSGYFYTLLVTSVCGAVCAMLAYGGFEKYIKYIASLVCLVIMISPFREIDMSEIETAIPETEASEEEYGNSLYQTAAELTEQKVEVYISEIVFNKFGIKPIATDIKIDWTEEDAVIEEISVALSRSDMESADAVGKYLCDMLGGEVNIVEAE